jgi:hypothetical protein
VTGRRARSSSSDPGVTRPGSHACRGRSKTLRRRISWLLASRRLGCSTSRYPGKFATRLQNGCHAHSPGSSAQVLGQPVYIGRGVLGENEAFNPGQHHQGWIKIGTRADVHGPGDLWPSVPDADKKITGVPYYFRVLW